ncbi:MAG: hypothetical protein RLZ98_2332 [Pseudomonadota bacterium]|jgi:tripartite-type tricarboxylate transporter receptor subunit TctC
MQKLIMPTRRGLLQGGAATAALSALPFSSVFAQSFPSQNIKVMVATSEGGGADRNLRAFWSVWKKYLKTEMEASYYPGGSGRVGYQMYMGKAEPDCYTLLFGNMGPEILNWVVAPPRGFKYPGDYKYFLRTDSDPSCVFVKRDGNIKTIDDLIEIGKKRELKVAASRIAHPAVIGLLALSKEIGIKVNIVPYSGGRNTLAAVTSGEMDCGALPAGGVVSRPKAFKVVLLFDDKNVAPNFTDNAPLANQKFGTRIPALPSSRAFALKTEAMNKHPDRLKVLLETARKAFADPEYKTAVEKTKSPWEFIDYGELAECEKHSDAIFKIGNEFKALITGKG